MSLLPDPLKFNDFFSLFAALNLGYAASAKFRNIVDSDILRIYNVKEKFQETITKVTDKLQLLEDDYQAILKDEAEEFIKDKRKAFRYLNVQRRISEIYTLSYPITFWLTALYCIFMLVISGFQPVLKENYYFNFILFGDLIFAFNVFVFIRSLTILSSKKIKPIIVPILLGALIVAAIFISMMTPFCVIDVHGLQIVISAGLIVAVSPYIIHYLRALIHRHYFKNKYKAFLNKTDFETDVFLTHIADLVINLNKLVERQNQRK